MPAYRATVVIATLAADNTYNEALESLRAQSIHDFEVVVVDNSGRKRVPESAADRVIYNEANVGFGAAINQGFRDSEAPFLGTLNDDAVASPRWLESLISTMEGNPRTGMCASQVRLANQGLLDSAGMLMCADGSSKQRGHFEPVEMGGQPREVLLPSASAALYRRAMLDQVGLFDESFFLYCEDTDLGLRGRWAGWTCLYVPEAVVEHRYSHSAGRASALKAYYVERNRLFLVMKNFPLSLLAVAPLVACARYFWHAWFAFQGRGIASKFAQDGNSAASLPWLVLRAHLAMFAVLPRLLRQRGEIRRVITAHEFAASIRANSISPRQVAAL